MDKQIKRGFEKVVKEAKKEEKDLVKKDIKRDAKCDKAEHMAKEEEIMECGWIDVNVKLPEESIIALVTHWRRPGYVLKAIYYKEENVFQLYDLSIRDNVLLNVTHWLPIPNPPNQG